MNWFWKLLLLLNYNAFIIIIYLLQVVIHVHDIFLPFDYAVSRLDIIVNMLLFNCNL